MKNYLYALIWGVSLTSSGVIHAANDFADSVIGYVQGGGGVSASYNNSSVALGAPTTGVDGSTPYSITYPAWKNSQIVGIGVGGQLTLGFSTPILNDPTGHVFGMDFIIFGNDFFANGSSGFTGASTHPGLTVWVSQDNVTYYQLHVPNGYGADDSFPAQGDGNPLLPVNPSLTLSAFVGLTQPQALSLYNGSAGGAPFSLSWAQDSGGNPINLTSVSYIQIQGTSGFGYVDAVSRVQSVPEPSGALLLSAGMSLVFFRLRSRAKTSGCTDGSFALLA
ncbi:MAG: hypothetical protein ACAI37_13680 [Chthoniobacter sp.]